MIKRTALNSSIDTPDLKSLIRKAGLKLTPQRLEILRLLTASDFHPDAESVFLAVRKKIPSVSRDTVYRNLRALVDQGLAGTLNTSRGAQHFEGNLVRHHHFFCTRCGLIRDFLCPDFDLLRIPDVVRSWGRIHRVQVELTGLCEPCLRRSPLNPRRSVSKQPKPELQPGAPNRPEVLSPEGARPKIKKSRRLT